MNNQAQVSSTPGSKPNPEIGTERKPALHTMQSDAELLKITSPSLLKRINQETTKRNKLTTNAGTLFSLPPKTYLRIGTIAVIFSLIGIGWYFLQPLLNEAETPQPAKLTPPQQLFTSEASRTVNVNSRDVDQFLRLMEDSYRETERTGTIKRILVKLTDGPQERYMSTTDFFEFYRMAPPKNLLEISEKDIMPFFYYGQDGARFGAAIKVKSFDRAFAGMLEWETSLPQGFKPLFFNENPDILSSSQFEDRTYRDIDWRFLKLSQEKDLGVAYTVFPAKNVLVVTTSKSSMESVINRLFEAR